MNLSKLLVSSATAIAMAGTLTLAYAQTTPGTNGTGGTTGTTAAQPSGPQDASGTATATMGTDATTGKMKSNRSTMASRRAARNNGTGMNADGTMMNKGGTGMNADGTMMNNGTMSTERMARADRG